MALRLRIRRLPDVQDCFPRSQRFWLCFPLHEGLEWIRRLVALCLLPPWLVAHVALDLLNNAPWTGIPLTDHGILEFIDYFRGYWLNPTFIPIWNSWMNMGPRTTNHAEGWHSALRFRFRNRHPDLGEFLMEIQKWQNGYAVTAKNLIAGLQPAAPRRPQDVQNDNRIRQAKANLQAHINAQQALGQSSKNTLNMQKQ